MKILEVNKYAYMRRGAERHFLDVRDLLRRNGHEVMTLALDYKQESDPESAPYQVNYVGYNTYDSTLLQRVIGIGRLFWSFEARSKMKRLLDDFKPDVVHLHNIYHQLSPSILGPIKSLGIPMIMTVHDYNLVSPDKDAYYPQVGKHYYKFLFMKKYSFGKRFLLVLKKYWEDSMGFYEKNIDAYIVPSQYVKNILVEAGMSIEKITIIPHFVMKQEVKEIQRISLAKIPREYALYGGSLSKEKGVDILVDICERVRIPFVLAGTCENGFAIRSSEMVTYLGKQTREQMAVLMHSASCVVSASSLPETFGLLALEAGSFGKPFFGLRAGALSEIIVNGVNGFLASDTDALARVLGDFFAGKQMFDGHAIQKQTEERFGEKSYLKHFEALLHSLKKEK